MLAIAGGKGGCGKTTTAVGLATALARGGDNPLVADADRDMPDLHLVTDVPATPGLDALADGASLDTVARTTARHPNVAVVPAGTEPGAAAETALTRLREWPDHVLVDCPAGAARDAAVPLAVADQTLLVTTHDPRAIQDAIKTAAMARTLDAPPLGTLLVDRSGTGQADPLSVRDAQTLFDCPLVGRVPASESEVLADEEVRNTYQTVAKKLYKRNI